MKRPTVTAEESDRVHSLVAADNYSVNASQALCQTLPIPAVHSSTTVSCSFHIEYPPTRAGSLPSRSMRCWPLCNRNRQVGNPGAIRPRHPTCPGLVRISRLLDRLLGIADGLRNLSRIHGVAGITVVKHWYDPDWPRPHEPDMILAEFSLNIPYRVQWSAGGNIVDAETLAFSCC
jgi:hypothetical protein